MCRHPLDLLRSDRLLIGIVVVLNISLVQLTIRSVVDYSAHWNLLQQLRKPSYMIVVIVRNQHVVDLPQPCFLHCRSNTIRIAILVARPSCVNKQRPPRRSNKQRRLSAFHVHKVDLKCCAAALYVLPTGHSPTGQNQHSRNRRPEHPSYLPPQPTPSNHLPTFCTVARVAPVDIPPSTNNVWPVT